MTTMRIDEEHGIGRVFDLLVYSGKTSAPRGSLTVECENVNLEFAPYVRYNRHMARKLSMNYIKREIAWYIRADAYDTSIAEHAKIWGPMINSAGRINSCYGEYWFLRDTGVNYIVRELTADPFSRRAVIPMFGVTQQHHIDVRDVPCTTNIEFRLRGGKLNCRFVMRSQDAVLGLGNDLPAFSFLQEVVARLLGVELGTLTISVGSLHVYEKHFEMMKTMSSQGGEYTEDLDEMPELTLEDAQLIAKCQVPSSGLFAEWLQRLPVNSDKKG
jgi:thymidylate synthase